MLGQPPPAVLRGHTHAATTTSAPFTHTVAAISCMGMQAVLGAFPGLVYCSHLYKKVPHGPHLRTWTLRLRLST